MAPIPLTLLAHGERARLLGVDGGGRLTRRLHAMGLRPGTEVTIVHDSGGPLLLSLHDTRLAVGRGMAQKILVEILSGESS